MAARAPLAVIVAAHHGEVWRYLRYLGCDAATADDLTQETFLKLLGAGFEQRSPQATAAWLRTVARNLFLTSVRSTRQVASLADLELADAAWERAEAQARGDERRSALRDCLARLGERARAALGLQYGERRSGQEAAAALGVSHEHLRVLVHRAKQALRGCIQQRLGGRS